jgi:DNA replication protein DnaC
LKHHLKQLKLPTMENECEEMALRCAKENVDHLGYLLQLSERELLEREARATGCYAGGTKRRLKSASRYSDQTILPNLKTLESFDFKAQPSLNKMLVTELIRGGYLVDRESIILIGQPGTGKTHLATAFGIKACQLGKKVKFFRITELITKMIEARDERTLERFKRTLTSLDLLILDELGYVPASKLGSELFFDVISTAYERTSVIITTNLPFDQWTEVLGSQRLTGAVLDRLTHRCHILEASGESYRLKSARKRLKAKQE